MSQRNTNSSKNSFGYVAVAGIAGLLGFMAHKLLSSNEHQTRTQPAHQHGVSNSCSRSVPIQPSDQCLICCEELKPPMEQLPCEHLFHQNCILTWLEIQEVCPLCRKDLDRKQLDEYRQRATH